MDPPGRVVGRSPRLLQSRRNHLKRGGAGGIRGRRSNLPGHNGHWRRQFDPLDSRKEAVLTRRSLSRCWRRPPRRGDRGGKFENYQQIDSLREHVLVSSQKPLIETFLRQAGGAWIYTAALGIEAVARLTSLGIELPLAEVYSSVEFTTQSADPSAV